MNAGLKEVVHECYYDAVAIREFFDRLRKKVSWTKEHCGTNDIPGIKFDELEWVRLHAQFIEERTSAKLKQMAPVKR